MLEHLSLSVPDFVLLLGCDIIICLQNTGDKCCNYCITINNSTENAYGSNAPKNAASTNNNNMIVMNISGNAEKSEGAGQKRKKSYQLPLVPAVAR